MSVHPQASLPIFKCSYCGDIVSEEYWAESFGMCVDCLCGEYDA